MITFNPKVTQSVLVLRFTYWDKMDTDGSGNTNCSFTKGNLTLYDGLTESASVIQTFCGYRNSPLAPSWNIPISLTSSKALLKFRGVSGEFTVKYEVVKRDCGFRTSKPSGVIYVPPHKLNTTCEWFIDAPAGQVIQLEVPPVNLYTNDVDNCSINEIELRSTGPYMAIGYFGKAVTQDVTDDKRHYGFSMKYKFVEPDRSCGGEFVNVKKDFEWVGWVNSPNFGGFYPPDMDCTWKIFGMGNSQNDTDDEDNSAQIILKLTFELFDVRSKLEMAFDMSRARLLDDDFRTRGRRLGGTLDSDANSFLTLYSRRRFPPLYARTWKCSEDYVHVYSEGKLVIDACNYNKPQTQMRLNSPDAVIQFHSNSQENGLGFRIKYEAVCEKEFSGNGTIQTWNYPNGGTAGKCTYIIKGAPSQAIQITFKTIGLRVITQQQCFYNRNTTDFLNYVEFQGGKSDDIYLNQRYFCSRYPFVEEGSLTMSLNRPLTITVVSDGNKNFKGLLMEYKTWDIGCGGLYTGFSGQINSPNYPNGYLPFMHCVYTITVPWMKVVKLTFDNFNIELQNSGGDCQHDKLEIYESYQSPEKHGKLLGRFCGTMIPPVIVSSRYSMVLVFTSDRSVQSGGFSAKYEAIDHRLSCDRTLVDPSGFLEFNGSLAEYKKCEFHIVVPNKARILLNMQNFSIPCALSKLQIKNGPSTQSAGFASLGESSEVCDGIRVSSLRSQSNRITMLLTTTDSRTTYFNISYEQIGSGCGGHISGISGSVSSPQYPLKDSRNHDCKWVIAVALGNKIRFALTSLDEVGSADEQGYCMRSKAFANRLDILDSPDYNSKLLQRFCRKEVAPEPITSDDNEIVIHYKQELKILNVARQAGGMYPGAATSGFLGHFSTVCTDIKLSGATGSIQSPGYGFAVHTPRFCTWTVSQGNRIEFNVQHFNIEPVNKFGRSTFCSGNYLQRKKFEGCEKMDTDIFMNANKMDKNASLWECDWVLSVPIGKQVVLKVKDFSVYYEQSSESSNSCNYTDNPFQGIAVYQGTSNASGIAEMHCFPAKDILFTSHTNEIYVRLTIIPKNAIPDKHGIFFTAVYVPVDHGANESYCGADITVKMNQSTVLNSPNYPSMYAAGVMCKWILRPPPGHYLRFTLMDFQTADSLNKLFRAADNVYNRIIGCYQGSLTHSGLLLIFDGNHTRASKLLSICADLKDDQPVIDAKSGDTLVEFNGAVSPMTYKSGESQAERRVGFKLKVEAVCGGIIYADDQLRTFELHEANNEPICNITFKKKNEDDDGIYMRVVEIGSRDVGSSDVSDDSKSAKVVVQVDDESINSTHIFDYSNDFNPVAAEYRGSDQISVVMEHKPGDSALDFIRMDYSTEINRCGGEIRGSGAFLVGPANPAEEFDCEWTAENSPGNSVALIVQQLKLPVTQNCTDSFLEVRKFNESGEVMERICSYQTGVPKVYEEQKLWFRMRYRKPDEEDPDADTDVVPAYKIKIKQYAGGFTNSHVIEAPLKPRYYGEIIWKFKGEQDQGILIKFEQLDVPESSRGMKFFQSADSYGDDDSQIIAARNVFIKGHMPQSDIYLPYSSVSVRANNDDNFRFTWQSIPENEYKNESVETASSSPTKIDYACGGLMTATWTWQTIENPKYTPSDSDEEEVAYAPNLHCKWSIERPRFRGIDFVYLHFVTDHSRAGKGFRVQYRLNCNSFDHIPLSDGILDRYLTSPNYPISLKEKMTCVWTIILQSNRHINVQVEDLDLEETTGCVSEYLMINSHLGMGANSKDARYCGVLDPGEKANVTTPNGRLFIKYATQGASNRRGFRLRVVEYLETCSSNNLFLDEANPVKTFLTPRYPQFLPSSMDCAYLISAPNGHRLKFTIDPHGFRMEANGFSKNSSCVCDSCDFVELRDGPTDESPLFGAYCNSNPPSTITTTGNYLYLRIRTDSFINSNGFKATYELASCGGTINLRPKRNEILTSPNFPYPYPVNANCTWTIRSPNTHMVEARISHLSLYPTGKCSYERLLIRDGNSTGRLLTDPICISYTSGEWFRSSSSVMTIMMEMNGTIEQRPSPMYCRDRKCGFSMELRVSEIGCGGLITDLAGSITAPGYPNRLLPNGFIHHRFGGQCYGDLSISNGLPEHEKSGAFSMRNFCENMTTLTGQSDVMTVTYSDMSTIDQMIRSQAAMDDDTYYVPFKLTYQRVPANPECSIALKANSSMEYNISKTELIQASKSKTTAFIQKFCHAQIVRPENYGTTVVSIKNYTTEQGAQSFYGARCSDWGSFIQIKSNHSDPNDLPQLNERYCNATFDAGTNSMLLLYVNPVIDMYTYTWANAYLSNQPQNFILEVEFQRCGGIIENEGGGTIASPSFGSGVYLKNSRCLWQLMAPEGKVVKVKVEKRAKMLGKYERMKREKSITIVSMDIEYEIHCNLDSLVVNDGLHRNVIHRYCNREQSDEAATNFVLKERFRQIKTVSRYMTLMWLTDGQNEYKGWKIDYEFINDDAECGFNTKGMGGIITSPNFGNGKEYDNNLECVWDVQVPQGYHIRVNYSYFDIELTPNCSKDYLILSQEHNGKGIAPIGDYAFVFEDEEKEDPICGFRSPKDFVSESNRVKLNFTTDSSKTAKGFKAQWTAECGTVFTLSDGVVTSPGFPDSYPNKDQTCYYLINPQLMAASENIHALEKEREGIVVLKFDVLDLSSYRVSMDRDGCDTDYVEIIDVSVNRPVKTLCAGDELPTDPISIKGQVGVKFVTNETFRAGVNRGHNGKAHKGFKLTYNMHFCGGNIQLDEEKMVTEITSPAYPLQYQMEMDCIWNITAPEDRILSIKIAAMELELTEDCFADGLEIYDGSLINNQSSLGKYCGDMSGVPSTRFSTKSNAAVVRFTADDSINAAGFRLVVSATLGPAKGCGGKLMTASDTWKTLSNPRDQDGNYYNGLACGWTIKSPDDTTIEIRIDAVDTEELEHLPGEKPKKYCVDELTIFDGYRKFSPILVNDICTKKPPLQLPMTFFTSHSVAYVYFETDENGVGKGFNISYREAKLQCGGTLSLSSDKDDNIFYETKIDAARTNEKVIRCRWFIKAQGNQPIELEFSNFNIDSKKPDCSDSFLEIRDVGILTKCDHPACARDNKDKKNIHLCGSALPARIVSGTQVLQLTSSAIVEPGKKASFNVTTRILNSNF
ncbi:hypothetical protein WR25_26348 [Diploscapter pachys]|uniref:CUB domain-containing protein n=1 Tax=Diploscapter pachys TaxID=2018661 RepID=A0A2A2JJF8_9BILA|nr:hypothetical protein WR25_26348 [Diploscapter pachys]